MQERKVEIRYLLSEKGRKESLLAGGDGKHRQTVYTDITPDALRLARVDEEGNVLIGPNETACSSCRNNEVWVR